jgi:hypothetical protein
MDGYAEYTFNSVSSEAWALSKSLPVTNEWAAALGELFRNLAHYSSQMDDALEVAERWRPSPDDESSLEHEANIAKNGYLWSHGLVRQSLVKLKGLGDHKRIAELLASDDYAFRAAVYESRQMTPDQIRAAYERDKNLAVNYCQENLHIWRDPECRKALHDISWAACEFNNNYMDSANAFNDKAEKIRAEHPHWFKDEEDAVDESGLPATKGDIVGLYESLAAQDSLIREHAQVSFQSGQHVATTLARLGWVWWFSLGALVASLLRYF